MSGTKEPSYFRSRYGATAFGLASLLIGIGLLYGIVTGSIDLMLGTFLATLALVVISLYVVFRQEGVLTVENRVIGIFVLLALGLFFGLHEYTTFPSVVILGSVIIVGVVVPNLLLNRSRLNNE